MSETGDDDLLNGEDEFDYEGYDIDYAKEEALLQEDEYDDNLHEDDDYKQGSVRVNKKDTVSDEEDEDDVLNLDVEDDFQVEDKSIYEEKKEKPEKKRVEEKPKPISTPAGVKKVLAADRGQPKRPPTTTKTLTNNSIKVHNAGKKPPRNDKFKRGTGRGNFHSRSNFNKSEFQRRRNGTVLINPRYQGTVNVNDNARLAWDNNPQPSSQSNTNFIQPWASANSANVQNSIISLMSELASFTQAPNLFNVNTQPIQNDYFQGLPSTNVFEPPVFQPPVNTSQFKTLKPAYSMQDQIPDRQMHTTLPNITSQSYQSSGPQNQFTRQISNDRMHSQSAYNSYNERTENFQSNYSQSQNNSYYQPDSYEHANYNYNQTIKQNDYNGGNNIRNYERRNSNYTNNSAKETNYNKNLNYNKYNDKNDFNQMSTANRGQNHQNNEKPVSNFSKNTPQQNVQNQSNRGPKTNNNGKNQRKFTNKKRISVENIKVSVNDVPDKKVKLEEIVEESTSSKPEDLKMTISTKCNASTDVKQSVITNVEEDEEMKLYNLKIEEQKRKREEVLRRKEENRKRLMEERKKEEEKEQELRKQQEQQAQQKQYEQQQQEQSQQHVQQQPQQYNRRQQQPPPQYNQQKGFNQLNQHQPQPTAILPKFQPPHVQEQRYKRVPPVTICKSKFELSTQKPKFDRPRENITIIPTEITNLTFEVSNDFQTKQTPKTETSSSSFMSNRVVVVKNNTQKSGANPKPNIIQSSEATSKEFCDVDKGFSSFFNNRKVLKKDNALLKTRLVLLNNLSTSTDQNKIMAMARGIGDIQKLRMDKQERQATILFKSVASAHAFFMRYQRHMLDLSVIEVKLEPML